MDIMMGFYGLGLAIFFGGIRLMVWPDHSGLVRYGAGGFLTVVGAALLLFLYSSQHPHAGRKITRSIGWGGSPRADAQLLVCGLVALIGVGFIILAFFTTHWVFVGGAGVFSIAVGIGCAPGLARHAREEDERVAAMTPERRRQYFENQREFRETDID